MRWLGPLAIGLIVFGIQLVTTLATVPGYADVWPHVFVLVTFWCIILGAFLYSLRRTHKLKRDEASASKPSRDDHTGLKPRKADQCPSPMGLNEAPKVTKTYTLGDRLALVRNPTKTMYG